MCSFSACLEPLCARNERRSGVCLVWSWKIIGANDDDMIIKQRGKCTHEEKWYSVGVEEILLRLSREKTNAEKKVKEWYKNQLVKWNWALADSKKKRNSQLLSIFQPWAATSLPSKHSSTFFFLPIVCAPRCCQYKSNYIYNFYQVGILRWFLKWSEVKWRL